LPGKTFLLFGAWLSFALLFYFGYSIRHSALETSDR